MKFVQKQLTNQSNAQDIKRLSNVSTIASKLIADRTSSISEGISFISDHLQELTHPFDIPNVKEACERIISAIHNKENISIFGDYDADGITSTVTLVKAIKQLGGNVKPFFPSRSQEGYGLSIKAIDRLLTMHTPNPSLIVTVDLGITSVAEVDYIKSKNIDIVVTDHHLPKDTLPNTLIVDPIINAPIQSKYLCGCGTAFTLVRGFHELGMDIDPMDYIDIVAVATIGDIVPLLGDNRTIVKMGLSKLKNRGLLSLVSELKLDKNNIQSENVAFSITPCINAASRYGDVKAAYKVLGLNGAQFAKELVDYNEKRKSEQLSLMNTIKENKDWDGKVGIPYVYASEELPGGLVGLIAGRIAEDIVAPTIVFHYNPKSDTYVGSMRSGDSCNAIEVLNSLKHYIAKYGGHAGAAGLSIKKENFENFCKDFETLQLNLPKEKIIAYDIDLDEEKQGLTLALCNELDRMEPFGAFNKRPVFVKTLRVYTAKQIGSDSNTLSLVLIDDNNPKEHIKAVWFRHGYLTEQIACGKSYRFAFNLTIDRFREPKPSVQVIEMEL